MNANLSSCISDPPQRLCSSRACSRSQVAPATDYVPKVGDKVAVTGPWNDASDDETYYGVVGRSRDRDRGRPFQVVFDDDGMHHIIDDELKGYKIVKMT